MKTCCCTGHRPKGFPWKYATGEVHQNYIKVLKDAVENLIKDGFEVFYTGMALGVDLDFAEAVIALKELYPNIQLYCAIPCPNQTTKWKSSDVYRYRKIISYADYVVEISPRYTFDCMLARNRYMVDHSDLVLAVWNEKEEGGTWYTISYATQNKKQIKYILLNTFINK